MTLLFRFRSTALYGYLLNGLIAIYETILMAHFSIADILVKSLPPQDWLIKSTLPDIAIAWADFFVGKALFDLCRSKPDPEAMPGFRAMKNV